MDKSSASAIHVAAGIASVAQNALMARDAASSHGALVPLVLNSVVGLMLLIFLLLTYRGQLAFGDVVAAVKPSSPIPGLLGTLFVIANLNGYGQLGSAQSICILIASQLATGVCINAYKNGFGELPSVVAIAVGATMVAVGTYLILRCSQS